MKFNLSDKQKHVLISAIFAMTLMILIIVSFSAGIILESETTNHNQTSPNYALTNVVLAQELNSDFRLAIVGYRFNNSNTLNTSIDTQLIDNLTTTSTYFIASDYEPDILTIILNIHTLPANFSNALVYQFLFLFKDPSHATSFTIGNPQYFNSSSDLTMTLFTLYTSQSDVFDQYIKLDLNVASILGGS